MKRSGLFAVATALLFLWNGCSRVAPSLENRARAALSQTQGRLRVEGLSQPVEVLRDQWGVPHIYAQTADDLFFAQGFVVAQDRLFQMDVWRRIGAGELSEMLGPAFLERDRFARLVRYRGDMDAEWSSYAPDAKPIVEAFARGVNAFIRLSGDRLPIEFHLLGARPGQWKPEDCLLRIAGLLMTRNAVNEVTRAQLVARLGLEKATELLPPDPPIKLSVPQGLTLAGIDARILQSYEDAIGRVRFENEPGSNNWVVDGTLSATGKPLLANDPHRPVVLPSLRYVTHLVGPGWNVIGAGEPALPGVAMGHNDRIAFGVTNVAIDQQDIYVEKTDPNNPRRYHFRGDWREMQVERERVQVKGRGEPVEVELKFTVHGPVIYEEPAANRAFVLKWVGSEPGTAGYLAGLSLSRAQNWQEFLAAVGRYKVPSLNLIYADVDGNIGWQPSGLAPIRKNWSGLLPVPGDSGLYEWEGFLDNSQRPQLFNPPQHYVATANHNILPKGYPHRLAFEWAAPFRISRINEVLKTEKKFTVEDFQNLQQDVTSVEAREWVALLRTAPPGGGTARQMIEKWDGTLSKDSAAAAFYEIWLPRLIARFVASRVPADLRDVLERRLSHRVVLDLLKKEPAASRNGLLSAAFADAIRESRKVLGEEDEERRWGNLHQIRFHHPLALNPERRKLFDLGPVSRGGDSSTVNNTGGSGFRQESGASYRQIFDVADWDRSVATSVPGQSGQPTSPHYADLLPLWAEGKYFPLPYTRAAVEKHTKQKLILEPKP